MGLLAQRYDSATSAPLPTPWLCFGCRKTDQLEGALIGHPAARDSAIQHIVHERCFLKRLKKYPLCSCGSSVDVSQVLSRRVRLVSLWHRSPITRASLCIAMGAALAPWQANNKLFSLGAYGIFGCLALMIKMVAVQKFPRISDCAVISVATRFIAQMIGDAFIFTPSQQLPLKINRYLLATAACGLVIEAGLLRAIHLLFHTRIRAIDV